MWLVREGSQDAVHFLLFGPDGVHCAAVLPGVPGFALYPGDDGLYAGFPYVMASLVMYVAPILLALLIIALLAGLMLDGGGVWLGESAPIGRQTEWTSGIMFALMATWPIFIGYGLVGLVIWILAYREMDQERVVASS